MALTNQKHFTNKPLPFHRQIKKNHQQIKKITDKPKKQIAKKSKKSPRNQTKKGPRKVIFEV